MASIKVCHILNLDSHVIHNIILPLHIRYPFGICTTRQHLLFRNALTSLIIDLGLSGSQTAWLYDSSATSSCCRRPWKITRVFLHGFGVLVGHLIHSCYFISPNKADTFRNLCTLIAEHEYKIAYLGYQFSAPSWATICGFFSSICRSMFASGEIASYPVTVHSIAIMSQY